MVWLWANITTAHVAKTGNRPQRRLVAKTRNRPGSRGPAICSLPNFPEFAQAVRYGVPGTHLRHILAIGQPDHLDPQGARACCKVGLDRPLIPAAFVANLSRSAKVFRPRRSPNRGSPVTHRRPGRGKGSLLNSASLTPKPLASSVYVHVLEAPSPLKRSISVMSLFPPFFPPLSLSEKTGVGTRCLLQRWTNQ